MPRPDEESPGGKSLWDLICVAGKLWDRVYRGPGASVTLGELSRGSSLQGRVEQLHGRSVLLATRDQLATVLALIELDGTARRLVLCPADLPSEHLPFVAETAGVDALVSDRPDVGSCIPGIERFGTSSPTIAPASTVRGKARPTEWVLLTSGTTGRPKLVLHTLTSLAGAIGVNPRPQSSFVWSTFYDIRRYGGLQILLRALIGGGSMVLSSALEPLEHFLLRASASGVTHISGTPSHWRRALMSPAAGRIAPWYIRLSGEVVDQAILDNLAAFYPKARIAHAFASTEAGVAFDVQDGIAGFPAGRVGQAGTDVDIMVEDGSLRIRSGRVATRYLGGEKPRLTDKDGFIDTGDLVTLRDGRYHFVGRRDGVINVGGQKVHPEEVEAVINRHPRVQMAIVKSRKSPVTGSIVVADIVARTGSGTAGGETGSETLQNEILDACQRALAPHKVPALIRLVPSLGVGASGKLARSGA